MGFWKTVEEMDEEGGRKQRRVIKVIKRKEKYKSAVNSSAPAWLKFGDTSNMTRHSPVTSNLIPFQVWL